MRDEIRHGKRPSASGVRVESGKVFRTQEKVERDAEQKKGGENLFPRESLSKWRSMCKDKRK